MKWLIKGFIPNSLVDWDGKVSAVIFLGGCNFRCGFCSNKDLVLGHEKMEDVDFEKIKNYLEKNKDFVDGVVINGGEPTAYSKIAELCRAIKYLGFKIKLETNGSNPDMLNKLLNEKLLDCIAMDIKTKLKAEEYKKVTGSDVNINDILRSITIIKNSGIDYVFRTTVIPGLHNNSVIRDISFVLNGSRLYHIQNFHPENGTLDSSYEKIKKFNKKELEEFKKIAEPFFEKVVIRTD